MNPRLSLFFLSCLAVLSLADEASFTPLLPGSRWSSSMEGAAELVRAGRTDRGFLIEGRGFDVLDAPSRLVLSQRDYGGQRSITARLISISGPVSARAGISIEASINKWLGMRMECTAQGELLCTGKVGVTTRTSVSKITLPHWLRVQWRGGGLAALHSMDGTTWTELLVIPVTMPLARFQLFANPSGVEQNTCAVWENVVLTGGDADDNGIGDGWEIQHFGALLGRDAEADPDSDGRSTRREWLESTDAKAADPPPRIEMARAESGDWELTSFAQNLRTTLQVSTDLRAWREAIAFSTLIGTPKDGFRAVYTFPIPPSGNSVFFRMVFPEEDNFRGDPLPRP